MTFEDHLKRFGPDAASASNPPCRIEAEKYCRELATSHYENFPLVSWLLPRSLHQHFYNVYAYCRWADDLGDEVGDSVRSLELLRWWKNELQDCYAGTVKHPVFVALRPTIGQFQIPIDPFLDLISAFEQDQTVKQYDTFDQLIDYCRRSADPVGRIVLCLCGASNPQNILWSDSICTGLQLANFWQDVARDYAIGRIYLPREDCARFGFHAEDFERQKSNRPFQELMKFQVDRARTFLQFGLPLVDHIPGRMKVDIDLFVQGGLCILKRIEAIDYRVWETRPRVTKWDAARLLIGSIKRLTMRSVGWK